MAHHAPTVIIMLLLGLVVPAPGMAQTPQPVVSAPFSLGNAPGSQSSPDLIGGLMVYSNCPDKVCSTWGLDLASRNAYPLSQSVSNEYFPSTDGVRLVWTDGRGISGTDPTNALNNFNIYGMSLADKKEFPVTTAALLQSRAKVWGNVVVWSDFRDAGSPEDSTAGDIYMYDIAARKESAISRADSAQIRPVTNGRYVVWVDYRNEPSPDGSNSDIYAYDLATKQEFVISNAPGAQLFPAMSGDTVVWSDWRNGGDNSALYGYDLATRQEFVISNTPGSKLHPAISGNLVVWEDNRNEPDPQHGYNNDIFGYDLTTKHGFPIYVGPGWQGNPSVSGNTVAWEENMTGDLEKGDYHIKGATISGIQIVQPQPAPPVIPGTGSAIFAPTGKTVTGIFLEHWQSGGGIAQVGYPISDPMYEVSDLDGKTYIVQYFERAVFEYHPENQPPNNVLLSQLGTFRYKQKYPNGTPPATPNNTPGAVFFPETSKWLGGRFLAYWQQHGGLPQQGYPISDEFTEISDLDGKPYLVQYFERAVFEYHPEISPPNDVLLSQLGTFRYKEKYGGR